MKASEPCKPTKFAAEGITESLAPELAPLGIHVTKLIKHHCQWICARCNCCSST